MKTIKTITLLIVITAVVLIAYPEVPSLIKPFSTSHSPLLQALPPSYIKTVVAYKEGSDGVVIYFILANDCGEMIASKGTVTVSILQDSKEIFTRSFAVETSDFYKTTIGIGPLHVKLLSAVLAEYPIQHFLHNLPQGSLGLRLAK